MLWSDIVAHVNTAKIGIFTMSGHVLAIIVLLFISITKILTTKAACNAHGCQ